MTVRKEIAKQRERRRYRVRNHIRRSVTASGRLRLSIFRSNKHIYAQIIDDMLGVTLVSANTMEKDVAGSGKYSGNKESAAKIGELIAKRAGEKGITSVVLDRGLNKYHGRVAVLAEAARENGLQI